MNDQEQSGPQPAMRLIFAYEGDDVRLVSRQPVTVVIPPSDPVSGYEGEQGFWIETRAADQTTLHRRILPDIVGVVAPDGVLIYETFAIGQERFGRPQRTDFLLNPGELIEAVRGVLIPLAFEHGRLTGPDRIVQRSRSSAVRLSRVRRDR